jgi:hypothetical protein
MALTENKATKAWVIGIKSFRVCLGGGFGRRVVGAKSIFQNIIDI